ncbi:MAG: hypothetical protein AAGF47_02730 [Planctomycetota bacterium]
MSEHKNLSAGKLLAAAPLAAVAGGANGQIVYTELGPVVGDISYPGASTLNLDFDQDSIADMRIRQNFISGQAKVFVDGDASNSENGNAEDEVFTALGGLNPLALSAGDLISDTPGLGQAWTFASNDGQSGTSDIWRSTGSGDFAVDGLERFFGVRTVLNGNTHYGWVGVVLNSEDGLEMDGFITGYAYNSVPNGFIEAGQIPAPGVGAVGLLGGAMLARRRRSA